MKRGGEETDTRSKESRPTPQKYLFVQRILIWTDGKKKFAAKAWRVCACVADDVADRLELGGGDVGSLLITARDADRVNSKKNKTRQRNNKKSEQTMQMMRAAELRRKGQKFGSYSVQILDKIML
jgi:hypothetical protein